MSQPLQPAQIDWSQGLPFAENFGDIYFSAQNGDAETQHVFLAGNQLSSRFQALSPHQSFTIIETGFGTGLNWLCVQKLWESCNPSNHNWLHFVSIEKHPLTLTDLTKAHTLWPHYAKYAKALHQHYPFLSPGFHRLVFPQFRSTLTLVFSDIQEALPLIEAKADAWFLDGFAPDRNPDMWGDALFKEMARHSHDDTTLATFTVAGIVRRGLSAAGFSLKKIPGYGQKREMLTGTLTTNTAPNHQQPWLSPSPISNEALLQRKAIIIGAGVAGACTARSLADRGWDITVLEKNTIASGASGNPAAIVSIIPCSTSDILTHFPQQASLHTLRVLQKLFPEENTIWHACGLVELPATSHQKTFSGQQQNELPDNLWRKIDGATVSTISGATITTPAVFQPQSGWLDAQQWCRFLLNHPLIKTQENTDVLSLLWDGLSWQIKTSTGLISTPVIILANGFDALSLLPDCPLPLRVVRGQVSRIKPSPLSSPLKTIVASNCYLSPPDNAGLHCLGATFTPDDLSTEICAKDHEDLRLQLKKILPDIADSFADCGNWKGRSSIRCQSEDYLPLVGAIATKSFVTQHYAGLRHGKLHDYPPLQPLPNLYVNIAHGSHGFSHALLAAEILVSEMLQEPSPCAQKMRENLHPIRFLIRQLKRGKI